LAGTLTLIDVAGATGPPAPLARQALVIIGFGSVLLNSTSDIQFTLLAWADGMQPYIGVVVGLIGVALLASPFILRARQARANGRPAMPGQQPGFDQRAAAARSVAVTQSAGPATNTNSRPGRSGASRTSCTT
jgi:hypothetical protein